MDISISNLEKIPNETKELRKKKKRRRSGNVSKWIAESEQRCYSVKLLDALRHIRRYNTLAPSRAVQEAAGHALAVVARGRTRWSRAILFSRLKKRMVGNLRSPGKRLPPVRRRRIILGRLIPGCQRLKLPDLLEEARDYIAALEMQVRAMTSLTELLASSSARFPPSF